MHWLEIQLGPLYFGKRGHYNVQAAHAYAHALNLYTSKKAKGSCEVDSGTCNNGGKHC